MTLIIDPEQPVKVILRGVTYSGYVSEVMVSHSGGDDAMDIRLNSVRVMSVVSEEKK